MTHTSLTLTERIVKKDRWIIIAGLSLLTLLSWFYLVTGAGTGMSTLAMTNWKFPLPLPAMSFQNEWTISYAGIMLLMWWVMMIAMMIPSASPAILLYARVVRNAQTNRAGAATIIDNESSETLTTHTKTVAPTAFFAAGYLLAWLLFSIAAVFLQWLFEFSGLLHGMKMWSTNYVFSALLLIIAGLYQLSALKVACLRHCRSPAEYIANHWRRGSTGAIQIGLNHGLYCVGCCWSLMALLFVGGAMNLIWIAGLGVLVLLEKTFPSAQFIPRLSAMVLITAGGFLLVGSAQY